MEKLILGDLLLLLLHITLEVIHFVLVLKNKVSLFFMPENEIVTRLTREKLIKRLKSISLCVCVCVLRGWQKMTCTVEHSHWTLYCSSVAPHCSSSTLLIRSDSISFSNIN